METDPTAPDPMQPTWPSTALVVGGSRGIGRQAVIQLAGRGVHCAIGYQSRTKLAEEVAAEASRLGPEPVLVQGDQGTDPRAFVEATVEALGGCGSVVTTAVPMLMGRLLDVTADDYRAAMDVQVWGLQELVRAALPHLEADQGSVVTVSSLGAGSYASYYGAIGPAKGALETTVRYFGAELGKRGVRVNAVSPCLVDDPSHTIGIDVPETFQAVIDAVARRTPLRRLATSVEIASVIVALLSSSFRFVTGQVIPVDGGYSLLA
ncbi:MAG TPA: SDR family oxidoreductase [Acidimicrobiia bacterium]|nr:SDR family oxidoreductase [Acidimicrobiia bacterium]